MVVADERDSDIHYRGTEGRSYEDPHTVLAFGIRSGMRPIGKNGVGR